jgi:hypothetical protein
MVPLKAMAESARIITTPPDVPFHRRVVTTESTMTVSASIGTTI